MDLNTYLLIAVLTLLVLSPFFRGGSTVQPNASLDRKLDLILKNLGIDPYEGLDAQLVDLVRSGRKIEAIRLYRQQSGLGLKEAKDYVDGL